VFDQPQFSPFQLAVSAIKLIVKFAEAVAVLEVFLER
jgi:hypothetical protein